MRVLANIGACVLFLTTAVSAQSPALVARQLTFKLTAATLAEATAVVAAQSGITIRFDASVPVELRDRRLSTVPLSFVNAPVATVLEYLTGQSGLAFVVVDSTTVVIQVKAR
jgi:hypothetical protein